MQTMMSYKKCCVRAGLFIQFSQSPLCNLGIHACIKLNLNDLALFNSFIIT